MEYIGLFVLILLGVFIYFKINKQIVWIFFAMVFGVYLGVFFPMISSNAYIVNKLFIRSIKCIIGPLLFSTLLIGIASHSDLRVVGRMGWKSLLYFEVVTTIALIIGLAMINLFPIGKGIEISKASMKETVMPNVEPLTWQDSVIHIMPESIFKALTQGDILQIVIFSILFSIAVCQIKENFRKPIITFGAGLAEVMFKLTSMVMFFAPLCVAAAMAHAIHDCGFGILQKLMSLVVLLYGALVAFVILALLPVALIIKLKFKRFFNMVKEPIMLAFATTSSESALPKAMSAMERYGVNRRVVSFVMPLGYSFNLDGTTLYLSLASVFVAQVVGKDLSLSKQVALVLALMLSSKGVAGVPRASLVILLATLADFGIDDWPVMVMFGVDELMDMARTSVNVLGNCIATVVVGKWEGLVDENSEMYEGVDN